MESRIRESNIHLFGISGGKIEQIWKICSKRKWVVFFQIFFERDESLDLGITNKITSKIKNFIHQSQ